ncbi:sugar phosphate nucleotidyltransferase [Exiguobacterium sp. s16]|uniref:sugar phosphate nucleotidyltransferase n=1 Tax=Exiguobacterium sp. s16 TaxID=2751237 RepID=UPI001BE78276|nr:sugar phosphate nucleotidyltransferase [Exiguobacterium sp. s16]
MKLVLLSGGSGKRLWPLSNDTRSKQFLKVLESQKLQQESMVQRVWGQLEATGLAEDAMVATSKMQRDMIFSHIGEEVPLIIEPERRDTYPAIALATTYLSSIHQVDRDEVVVVLPVDPYVDNAFFERVKLLEEVLHMTNADLALMGVSPTYPSSKYGYIVPEQTDKHEDAWVNVDCFTEKPSEDAAKKLIESGALWNCGVFAFRLGYLLDTLVENELPTDYDELLSNYETLPKISFDYAVVEKAARIVAVPYQGYWKDLGTWNTLTEEMATTQLGKGTISEDSINTHLINELDLPVTIIGGKNLIVAASPDGILISDKESSPKIKDYIHGYDQPPMYEERLWGWSRTLDFAKYDGQKEMVTKRICIYEGRNSSYHKHALRDEVWTIVRGEGDLVLDGRISRVKAGDIVHLPAGKEHGIRALSELEFIEVQTGAEITEDDFDRIFYMWDEIVAHFQGTTSRIIY